jgi:lipooligosaccharide transport system permease protein
VQLVRPLLSGELPTTPWLNPAVLSAYAAAGFYLATVVTRKRLLT